MTMWKYLFAFVVTGGVTAASVYLFRHRDEFFRPDVHKLGGTLLAFSVAQGEPTEEFLEGLRRRFDPRGRFGVVVRRDEGSEVEILVPSGPAHDDLVDRVKRLAGRPGRFGLRAIANVEEDEAVSKHVAAQFAPRTSRGAPLSAAPPAPVAALGGREFPSSLAGAPAARYRWDRLAEGVVAVFSLDPTALAGRNAAEKPTVDRALASRSVFAPNFLPGTQVLAARLPGSADPTFFILTREEEVGQAITSDNVLQAEVIDEGRTATAISLRLDREGARRLKALSQRPNRLTLPHGARIGGVASTGYLAVVVDEEVVSMPQALGPGRPEVQLSPGSSEDDAQDLACLIRGGVKGARLNPVPSRVVPLQPGR